MAKAVKFKKAFGGAKKDQVVKNLSSSHASRLVDVRKVAKYLDDDEELM